MRFADVELQVAVREHPGDRQSGPEAPTPLGQRRGIAEPEPQRAPGQGEGQGAGARSAEQGAPPEARALLVRVRAVGCAQPFTTLILPCMNGWTTHMK